MSARISCDLIIHDAAELCTAPPQPIAGPSGGDRPETTRLGIIPNGSVACMDGRVVWVGQTREVESALAPTADCRRVDAAGRVVTPGLVDAHVHMPVYGVRAKEYELRLRGAGYLDILAAGGGILSTVRAIDDASDDQLRLAVANDLDFMLDQGVTTVEAKSGYGLTTEGELRLLRIAQEAAAGHPITMVSTFLGAHAVPDAFRGNADAYVEVILERMLPAVERQCLAAFCDVFCEPGVFTVEQSRAILLAGVRHGLRPKLHADELAAGGGAELAAEIGAVSADHLLFASPAGLAAMAAAGTVAVLLPVTVLSLLCDAVSIEHCRRQAAVMRSAGVRIAIGTDYNPGTAPCRAMQLAMALAGRVFGLSAVETILAATTNAAAALELAGTHGSLIPGYAADIVVWDAAVHEEIPYRLGENRAAAVFKAGRPVKGGW